MHYTFTFGGRELRRLPTYFPVLHLDQPDFYDICPKHDKEVRRCDSDIRFVHCIYCAGGTNGRESFLEKPEIRQW